MALTKELLEKETSLNELSDEQKAAIVLLSQNDEKATFSTEFGRIHSELDETIKSVTGVGKNTNEKTSDYLKRMLGGQKSSIEELTGKVSGLETEKADLMKKINDGSQDAELKAQLVSKEATIVDLQKKYQTKSDELKALRESHDKEIADFRINADLASAMSGLEFKEGFSEAILSIAKEQAMTKVRGSHPEYMKGTDGKEVLIFKDDNGVELRNPDNSMNLFTAQEMLKGVLGTLGVLADSDNGGGAGSNPPTPKTPKAAIGAVHTKVEAMEAIKGILAAKGLAYGTKEYQDAFDQEWANNQDVISKLS